MSQWITVAIALVATIGALIGADRIVKSLQPDQVASPTTAEQSKPFALPFGVGQGNSATAVSPNSPAPSPATTASGAVQPYGPPVPGSVEAQSSAVITAAGQPSPTTIAADPATIAPAGNPVPSPTATPTPAGQPTPEPISGMW
jgi:hypothetical protein